VDEIFGWASALATLALGLYRGIRFQRENGLGGSNAFPRRMVRLAYVAPA
jgi:hypothetical protein